jgi:hypothetical protein
VTKIGSYVFNTSKNMECDASTINLAQVTSFGTGTFQFCSKLTGLVTLNSSLTSISDRLFNGAMITLAKIPNGVKRIGYNAFQNTLVSGVLELPVGLETIGDTAFAGTQISGSVTLPSSVKNVGTSTSAGSRNGPFKNTLLTGLMVPGQKAVSSGEQTFTSISVQILLGTDVSGFNSPAKVFFAGHNTKMIGYSEAWRDKIFRGTKGYAFVPSNGHWENFTGSTGSSVIYYGPDREIDFSVDTDAKIITATPTTEAALVKTIEYANLFKTNLGYDTRINVTNNIEVSAGTITLEMLNSVQFNTMLLTFKVKTQAMLDSVLQAVPQTAMLAVDLSEAKDPIELPSDRALWVWMPGNGKYIPKVNGLVISFR